MGKMLHNWKMSFTKTIVIFLTIGTALQACSPAQGDSTFLISTPAQDKHAEAFMTYMKHLEEEGLTTAKEIQVKESQPFIFILKPQSQEITDDNVESFTELALRAVAVSLDLRCENYG
jgi:hypothetical protein